MGIKITGNYVRIIRQQVQNSNNAFEIEFAGIKELANSLPERSSKSIIRMDKKTFNSHKDKSESHFTTPSQYAEILDNPDTIRKIEPSSKGHGHVVYVLKKSVYVIVLITNSETMVHSIATGFKITDEKRREHYLSDGQLVYSR